MALYLKSRYKLGKHTSLLRVRKLSGKPFLRLLFSPVLLVIWIYTGLFALISKLWTWNPAVTKYILAGLFLVGGISSRTVWSCMIGAGVAALFILWAQFNREKKKASNLDTSEEKDNAETQRAGIYMDRSSRGISQEREGSADREIL